MRVLQATLALAVASTFLGSASAQATNSEGVNYSAPKYVSQNISNDEMLRQRAAAYSQASKDIGDKAQKMAGGFINIGTMYSEVDSKQHKCYALAVSFGKLQIAEKVEVRHKINLKLRTLDNAQDLAIAAHSMNVFEKIAAEVLRSSLRQRQEEWNLGCVSLFGISPAEKVGGANDSFYTLKGNGTVLVVLGNIEKGFHEQLKVALNKNPAVTNILLGSNGGAVYEGIAAGREIRKRNINTGLWNNCRSSCVFAFLGGIERRIDAPYPSLGLHSVYGLNNLGIPVAAPKNSIVYQDVHSFATEMGVSADALIFFMQSKPPEGMLDLDANQSEAAEFLCITAISTVVQRRCSSKDVGLTARFPERASEPSGKGPSKSQRRKPAKEATSQGSSGYSSSNTNADDPLHLDYDPLAPGAYKRYLPQK